MRLVIAAAKWLGAVGVVAAAGCAQIFGIEEGLPGGAGGGAQAGPGPGTSTATSTGSTGSAGTGGAPPACVDPVVDCDLPPTQCQVAVCQDVVCVLAVARNQACAFSGGKVCDGSGLCIDPDWANWPMPNGAVDADDGAPNGMGYTDHGDGTVTDNVTGLMWQKAVDAGSYGWDAAKAYCDGLDFAAYADWRLPTRIELASLVDYGVAQPGPTIRADVFPGTPATFFWSSTPLAGSASDAWYVDFNDGKAFNYVVSDTYRVRCVR